MTGIEGSAFLHAGVGSTRRPAGVQARPQPQSNVGPAEPPRPIVADRLISDWWTPIGSGDLGQSARAPLDADSSERRGQGSPRWRSSSTVTSRSVSVGRRRDIISEWDMGHAPGVLHRALHRPSRGRDGHAQGRRRERGPGRVEQSSVLEVWRPGDPEIRLTGIWGDRPGRRRCAIVRPRAIHRRASGERPGRPRCAIVDRPGRKGHCAVGPPGHWHAPIETAGPAGRPSWLSRGCG